MEKNAVKVGAEKQIFFSIFLCCKTFKIPQKLKALAIFVKIQKLISGYWLSTQIEISRYLKKYGVGPYAGLWGQNRSTGISRRPEFPAYEKKKVFSKYLKI